MYYHNTVTGEAYELHYAPTDPNWIKVSRAKFKPLRAAYCAAELRKLLKPGDTVHCIIRSVSRSGMSRVISLYVKQGDDMRNIDSLACDAIGSDVYPLGRDGLKVGGCGMDMCFAVVYHLSRRLLPDGFGVEGDHPTRGKLRPVSREAAAKMVALGWTFRGRNGDASGWDDDGGYALRHNTL
jgi:hypothetical protein